MTERERRERHRPAARTDGEGGQRKGSSRSGAACEAEDDGGQQRQQLADAMQWRLRRRLGCADVAARRCNGDAEAVWGGAARRADHHQQEREARRMDDQQRLPRRTPARRRRGSGSDAGEGWRRWRRRNS
ncbi:hypothetical protein Syun_021769 [Stephania yunnanensis]|uniref:Uncharacterized protein n=1 Tax=Stephania yunnanensis TaxID=152371 RepID=A0AAP0IGL4_9MAGN